MENYKIKSSIYSEKNYTFRTLRIMATVSIIFLFLGLLGSIYLTVHRKQIVDYYEPRDVLVTLEGNVINYNEGDRDSKSKTFAVIRVGKNVFTIENDYLSAKAGFKENIGKAYKIKMSKFELGKHIGLEIWKVLIPIASILFTGIGSLIFLTSFSSSNLNKNCPKIYNIISRYRHLVLLLLAYSMCVSIVM